MNYIEEDDELVIDFPKNCYLHNLKLRRAPKGNKVCECSENDLRKKKDKLKY